MLYGYYQAVRFIALIGFVILAYGANETNSKSEVIIFVCLAILFQPFIKIFPPLQLFFTCKPFLHSTSNHYKRTLN